MKRYLLTIIFWVFQCSVTLAVPVTNLDQATITVPDRSASALTDGLKAGFKTVLVKLSGNPQVMTLPTIQNALPDLQQWVQSYAYVPSMGSDGESLLQLQVQFDQAGLKQLLREAGQSLWPADRPLTLVYLQDDVGGWQNEIAQLAKIQGIPVIFPIMDLSDQSVIGDQAGNGTLTASQVQQLSARYGVNGVLVVHVQTTDNTQWQANGEYMYNGQVIPWQVTVANKALLSEQIVDKLMDMMGNQIVVKGDAAQKTTLTMNVVGVNNIADYAKVMHYLRERSDVTQVAVKDIGESGVLFSIDIAGSVADFQKILASDDQLKPVDSALAQNMHRADLYYYW